MAKLKYSKKRKLKRQTKPKADDVLKYIQHFSKERHQHYKFMLVARVSSWEQVKLGYLDSQLYRLRRFAKENGLDVLTDVCIVNSAFWTKERKKIEINKFQTDPELFPFDPRLYDKPHYFDLEEILVPIMKSGKDGAFLFESACRAIRSDNYSFENKNAPLTEDELKEFSCVVSPIPVITICHPEATFQEVDSWRKMYDGSSRRPNKSKGWTKRRYKKYHPRVIKHRAKGWSYGEIAKEENLPIELVRSWCRKAKIKGFL